MRAASRIPTVIYGQVALLVADSALTTALGGQHVYERMTQDKVEQIPGVYWYVPAPETIEETVEIGRVRYDIWAYGSKAARAIEARICALLHLELPEAVNGVVTFSQVVARIDLGNEDADIAHRVVEIEIQPVRLRRT